MSLFCYNEIINTICHRNGLQKDILDYLNTKNELKNPIMYISGDIGTGKTTFISNLLKKNNYKMIYYNACDMRNSSFVETIFHTNTSTTILQSFFSSNQKNYTKNVVIVLDDIESMISGDKGGINKLIKLYKPYTLKKNKVYYGSPVICIGNKICDKKIKELMNISYCIEIPSITNNEMIQIMQYYLPHIQPEKDVIVEYTCSGNLKKTLQIIHSYDDLFFDTQNKNEIQNKNTTNKSFCICKQLFQHYYNLQDIETTIEDNIRTTMGLLIHENIIDAFQRNNIQHIKLYSIILYTICIGDCLDKITFQKQLWIFHEISFLLKVGYTTFLFHETFQEPKKLFFENIRFTKIITKYSTQYNNLNFLRYLSQKLTIDKHDLFLYFLFLQQRDTIVNIYNALNLQLYDISLLDIHRLYRFLNKKITDEVEEIMDHQEEFDTYPIRVENDDM